MTAFSAPLGNQGETAASWHHQADGGAPAEGRGSLRLPRNAEVVVQSAGQDCVRDNLHRARGFGSSSQYLGKESKVMLAIPKLTKQGDDNDPYANLPSLNDMACSTEVRVEHAGDRGVRVY